jgi:hypothetical protein
MPNAEAAMRANGAAHGPRCGGAAASAWARATGQLYLYLYLWGLEIPCRYLCTTTTTTTTTRRAQGRGEGRTAYSAHSERLDKLQLLGRWTQYAVPAAGPGGRRRAGGGW